MARLAEFFEIDNSKLGSHDSEPTVLSLSKYHGFVRADDYFDKRIASAQLDNYKTVPVGGWAFSTIHIDEGSIALNLLEPGVISPMYTTMRWIGDGIALPDFLAHVVRQPDMLEEYKRRAQGSVNRRRSLPFKAFSEIEIQLPSVDEQRRIVAVVAVVDAQVKSLGREITRGSRVLDQIRNELPVADPVPLGEFLVRIDSGKSVQTAGEAPRAGLPRILKVSAVRPGTFRAEEAKMLDADMPMSSLVSEGDLLMTRSNTPDRVGYCARARDVPPYTYIPDLIWRLRVDEERIDADFLEQALASPQMRDRVSATASGTSASMRKINKRGLSTVSLPLPSLDTQRDFAAACRSAVAVADSLGAELAALRTVRTDLLTALLSQEITADAAADRFVKAG